MRVLSGRDIGAADVHAGPLVAVISESVARRFFPSENPVGKRLVHGAFDSKEPAWTVVGVVSDVPEEGLNERPTGTIYVPFDQQPQSWMTLVVRSATGEPARVLPALRRAVADVDREVPLSNETTLDDLFARSLGQQRFTMVVLGGFATAALLLAGVGVYGVIAYLVTQRSHEIGIRLALGAQRSDIVSLVGGRVLATTTLGIALGLAGAAAASGAMTKLLFATPAIDGGTYAVGAAVLLAAAGIAALVPTVRATRVNPATSMRAD
jgi:putative ABC transport system permease protein